jgi:pyrrolidone-carboxylate peptidase
MSGLLLYGFGPYDTHETNISGELVRGMQLPQGVQRRVFDVCFDRSMFIDALDACDPDVVIGLGQSTRSRKIRIERKAVNLMGERGEKKRPINRQGPDHLFMTLVVPHDDRVRLSYDAGTFVCNFSMYVIAGHCRGSDRLVGFVHLPKRYDKREAEAFVSKLVAQNLLSGRH